MSNRDDVWTQIDADSPYTDDARARVVLASIARELSDHTRSFVTADGRPQVTMVEEASRAVANAERMLAAAVVTCRAAGISWKDIGESLGVTKQTVQGRFTGAVEQWEYALARPERLPHGAKFTAAVAAELDGWAVRHRESHQFVSREHPNAPLSGGLRRMGPFEEQLDISSRRRRLLEEHIFPAAQLAPLYDREAVLHDRLAGAGVDAANNRAAADKARARAEECREHLAKEYPPLTIETAAGPRIAATWETNVGKYRCPVCPTLSSTTADAIRHAQIGHELPVPPSR
ncbi:hypothetical protein [Actinoplanes sp. GCM10030250]|uniref:hypothetical protein n=1 Tax=Actinoplanes sp. GCM10030250 TaxID=3273376 RepID=UPI003615416A